jgi:hypothetical protein
MDYRKADTLLEKYFAGETSLSEEKWLQEYFNNNKIEQKDHEYAREIFRYFRQEASMVYRKDSKPQTRFNRAFITRMAGIAAALMILASTLFFLNKPREPIAYAYINGMPVTDKDLAIEETEKVLLLVSNQFNRSTTDLSHLKRLADIEKKFTKQP